MSQLSLQIPKPRRQKQLEQTTIYNLEDLPTGAQHDTNTKLLGMHVVFFCLFLKSIVEFRDASLRGH